MASSVSVLSTTNQHHMDRLDAARALLGVSPATASETSRGSSTPNTSRLCVSFAPSTAQHSKEVRTVSWEKPAQAQPQVFQLAPPAVISNGLDALAALASSEQANWEHQRRTVSYASSSSDEEDDSSEAMPPPPPRGRRRSVSNPEGMEKWANRPSQSRRDFVLPASILEEELAEASAAMEAQQEERKNSMEQQQPESVSPPLQAAPISGLMSEEEQANLTPEELLKRARSRLLEDLSEGSLNGEKGVLTLPHSLSKYKEVYNKNGRIGIYTPAERAAIIARFNHKRSRRVWNKKIRYNCRKNLADRRMRVKGRFVKRSTEQQARKVPTLKPDQDMPDVTDPEAGFCPTEDQPFRRTRRHTIT